MRFTALFCLLALAGARLAAPDPASAHGILGRAFLPVPAWLFAWAAGIVLAASFFALARLWATPRLESAAERRLLRLPRLSGAICGMIGVGVFGLTVISGLAGTQVPAQNLAPTAIYVLFWVGIPMLSALLGDVFAAFSPWRALARGLAAAAGRARLPRSEPYPYPEALGHWPAVATILAFGWLELVYVGRQRPATLAVLAIAYALIQLLGMAAFGIEIWSRRGDGFGVAFSLFGRLSPFSVSDARVLSRRAPLSGLPALRPRPGTVPLLCAMIGTTTFDGALNGPLWRALTKPVVMGLGHLGLGQTAALEVAETLGLGLCCGLCAGLYEIGVAGMGTVSERVGRERLRAGLVHSLVPIAFGYLVAHYFSLLVTRGQAAINLISDPLGTGANLFGTASFHPDPRLLSSAVIWYVQVAALLAGHVGGLALAHDRALVLFKDPEDAAASQRWMLVVMVSFTCLGLWLLSAVNT